MRLEERDCRIYNDKLSKVPFEAKYTKNSAVLLSNLGGWITKMKGPNWLDAL